MSRTIKWMSVVAALTAALALTPAVSSAQASPPAHEHAGHGNLALDHGKKWSTDAALRTGMNNIREQVGPRLGAIHSGKLTTAQYSELAQKVEAEVGYIVANCKLEPKADAMLHLVIADIGAGVDALAGRSTSLRPAQGAAAIVTALNEYNRFFRHPGWKAIRAGH